MRKSGFLTTRLAYNIDFLTGMENMFENNSYKHKYRAGADTSLGSEPLYKRKDVTHGIATNYVLRYCVRVRRLIALTIFSAFRRYDNFSIAM